MLVTFLKPRGNFLKKLSMFRVNLRHLINDIFNPKIVNLYQYNTSSV